MIQSQPTLLRIDHDLLFRWLLVVLLAIEVAIVLLDAFISEFGAIPIGAARRLFNITREDGIPNFFSSFQVLTVGVVLVVITLVVRAQPRRLGSKVVLGWGVMAAIFLFMGIDDATKLHERIGTIFEELVTDSEGDPSAGFLGDLQDIFPSYNWQLVFGPFFAAVGVFLLLFLNKQLPSLQMKGLIVAAISLFVVAVAMDFIEGMDNEILEHVADFFSTDVGRVEHFSKSIEEFFEMAATTLFLVVFLKKLISLTSAITFQLEFRSRSPGV